MGESENKRNIMTQRERAREQESESERAIRTKQMGETLGLKPIGGHGQKKTDTKSYNERRKM